MGGSIPVSKKVSPFFTFFIIHSTQVGVGVFGFQRNIARVAGYDGWQSILLAGVMLTLFVLIMYRLLGMVEGGLYQIHRVAFGKWAGGLVSTVFIFYFCLFALMGVRFYMEVVHVWMFPELSTFWATLLFFLIVVYLNYGGFRAITGISFLSIVLTAFIIPLFLFILPYADFSNLLPLFDHSFQEILQGVYQLSYSILGAEVLLVAHPFIHHPEKSKKWSILAVWGTCLLYLYLAILSFSYFPEVQLKKNIWTTLTMWKIFRMPFVERFEYIGIATWFLGILPNTSMALWCAARLMKEVYSIPVRRNIWIVTFLCFIAANLIMSRKQLEWISHFSSLFGFCLVFVYIPALFVFLWLKGKVRRV